VHEEHRRSHSEVLSQQFAVKQSATQDGGCESMLKPYGSLLGTTGVLLDSQSSFEQGGIHD
jgi:hypothetical protein